MHFIYLFFLLLYLSCSYLLNTFLDFLKFQSSKKRAPKELENLYTEEESTKMKSYVKKMLFIAWIERSIFFFLTLFFLIFRGFSFLDSFLPKWDNTPVVKGIIVCSILFLVIFFCKIPFNAFRIFFIEKRFALSSMSLRTFIKDIFISLLVSFCLGLPLLATGLWLISVMDSYAWIVLFIVVSVWQVFIIFISPVWILPLFNRFRTLEDSSLKTEIEQFCQKNKFSLKGVFVIDGSRRSNKGNAFFTGFGKFKRIVLFDTLFSKMETDEIMSILAHEMGHFKLNHIKKKQIFSFIESFVTLFAFQLCCNSMTFFDNFSIFENQICYAIPVFLLFFQPFFSLFNLISLYFSRKFEYQADAYSLKTYSQKDSLVNALKKLLHNHLTPLNTNPLVVFFQHSHPPIVKRIRKL